MAKMYGVEIKSLKRFYGTEGVAFQGDVYYNGNKLGFWSQDGNGGPDIFGFPENKITNAVLKFKDTQEDAIKNIINASIFLDEIVNLNEIERKFKKWTREGYKFIIKVDDGYSYKLGACSYSDQKDVDKYIKKMTKGMNNIRITYYKSPLDFIIE